MEWRGEDGDGGGDGKRREESSDGNRCMDGWLDDGCAKVPDYCYKMEFITMPWY